MRWSFRLMIVVGILFLVAAWLAGPGPSRARPRAAGSLPRCATASWAYVVLARPRAAPALHRRRWSTSRGCSSSLILVALGATWIEITRRQTLREFPDARRPTLFADARARVSDWWDETAGDALRARRRRRPPRRRTPTCRELASLADLHAKGALTDEEYASAKARVLAGE